MEGKYKNLIISSNFFFFFGWNPQWTCHFGFCILTNNWNLLIHLAWISDNKTTKEFSWSFDTFHKRFILSAICPIITISWHQYHKFFHANELDAVSGEMLVKFMHKSGRWLLMMQGGPHCIFLWFFETFGTLCDR
jgi:hypothetical protein